MEYIKNLLRAEAEAVMNIPLSDSYYRAVDLIFQKVHEHGGKLIASGMGKAGQIALNIATTLSSTGTPSVFLHAAEAQHGDLGIIQEKDVLLLISNSGKTSEIIDLFELSHRLFPQLPVILITGNPDGDLVGLCDLALFTGNPAEICPLGLTPTTSTTTMTVIGDILVVLLMKKIGFTADDYAKRHHGGYLGQKSRFTSK
jgi:arabinose-5-phosphate isomerase